MASAVIGALRVNLGIDTAQFTEGLNGVRASMANVGKQLQGWGVKLSTYITAPLAAAGGAVAIAAGQMAKDIDELRKAAQISNVGFEDFQKLAFAARSVGIEGDKLADIFKDVNDRVGDFNATGGGPMKDFFENIAPKIGLTADAFKDLSGPQALQLYYDSLKKAGASQQDLTFYLEAMASDATALIPLLEQGGEGFRKLGEGAAVISEDQAAGLKSYNDSMRALGEAIKGVTIAIASSGVLEFITSLVQQLTSIVQALAKTNPELLKWGTVIAGAAAAIGPIVAGLGLFLTAIAAISAPVLAVVAGVTALTVAIVAFWPEINAAAAAIQSFLSGAWAGFVSAWDGMIEKVRSVGQAVVQFTNDVIAAFAALPAKMMEIGGQIIDGLWNGIKAQWETVRGGIRDLGTGIADTVKSTLGIHSPSRVMHEVGVNIMQGLSNGMTSLQGNVQGVAAQTANDVTGAFGELQSVGQSLASSIGDVFSGLVKGGDEAKQAIKGLLKQLGEAALNSGLQALTNAFGGGAAGAGGAGGGFGNIVGSIVKSLFGFSQGGSILPGGASNFTGVDSQVVAFRKKPSEQVDIYDPNTHGRRSGATSIRGGDIIIQGDASEKTVGLIRQAINENNQKLAYARENEWR